MPFDIENPIGTGTDQELLELTRATIAKVTAFGETRGVNGRTITMSDLPSLYDAMERLEARISSATNGGSGSATNYASFKRAK